MGEPSAPADLRVTPRIAWLPSQDPDAHPSQPLGARRGVSRDLGGGEMCWDLGAPGLDGVTTTAAAQGLFAAFILPLSFVGVATLTWSDWPRPLTLLLGAVGLAGCALSALLVVWPFIFAAAWRERILLSKGQLSVTRGVWPFRRTAHLGPAAGVTVREVPREGGVRASLLTPNRLGGPGTHEIELSPPSGPGARLGVWLDHAHARRLRDRLRAVIAAAPRAVVSPSVPPPPLGWTLARVRHAATAAFGRFRRDPAPVLFDISLFLGMGIAASLPDTHALLTAAYGPLALLGLLAFAVLGGDPSRVAGLTPAAQGVMRTPFVVALGLFSAVAGFSAGPLLGAALGGGEPRLSPAPLAAGFAAVLLAAILAGRRAFATARGAPRRPLPPWLRSAAGVVFLVALVGVTWVHERWAWAFVTDSRRGLGPLSIAMLPTSAALLVWPGRFLFTVSHPFEDGPRWAFVWIMLSFALFALAGAQL